MNLNLLNLPDDYPLPIADVAELTGYSVQSFYSPLFQEKHKLTKPDGGVWKLTVGELKDAGLLTFDGRPTRKSAAARLAKLESSLGQSSSALPHDVAALAQELESMRREIDRLLNENDRLTILLSEKDKQLEMVNNLIQNLGVLQKRQ